MSSNGAINWVVTEFGIDKNWKLKSWNDKTENYWTKIKKNVKVGVLVLHFYHKIITSTLLKYFKKSGEPRYYYPSTKTLHALCIL